MKKAIGIYVREGVNLAKYGFVKTERGYWSWRTPQINGGLIVDVGSLRLTPYLGFCTRSIAVIIKMAEDKAIVVENETDVNARRYTMRLTHEEMRAVERMRGYPAPSDNGKEITPTDVKTDNVQPSSAPEITPTDVKKVVVMHKVYTRSNGGIDFSESLKLEETHVDEYPTFEEARREADKHTYGWNGALVEIYLNNTFYDEYVKGDE